MNDFNVTTTDMHTCGEPVRIIETGCPEIKGKTILEKRKYVLEHFDYIRKYIIFEPRGHFDMFGVILVQPDIVKAKVGTIFMHNEGYTTMCGHAIIALGRYVIDKGIVQPPVSPETKVIFQCPCGPVEAFVEYDNGKTGSVRFHSVPAFVFALDVQIEIACYGKVTVDISFGGAFYAILSAESLGLDVKSSPAHELISAATALKEVLLSTISLSHPEGKDLAYLNGIILTDGKDEEAETENFVVFGDKELDRSPCGSGLTARVALQFKRQQISLGQSKCFFGPAGGKFKAKPVQTTSVGPYDAVIVEVSGKGHYMGSSTFTRESDDELGKGFLLE